LDKTNVLLPGAKAHDPLNSGAVVPTAIEDHHFASRWKMIDVSLRIHLGFLPFRRRWQGNHPKHPRADSLRDALDHAAFAGRVPAFEHDNDF
jgi:hypothetical protein